MEYTQTKYKIVGGTSYSSKTPDKVCNALENLRDQRRRVKLYYGNRSTGECWDEGDCDFGYIGRSGGTIKIPILVHNSRSIGGTPILDENIVKISESRGGKVIFVDNDFNITNNIQ